MKRFFSIFLTLSISASIIAQTGGGYNLEQNVIGNGGWRSEGGGFTLLGTMGQGNAGSTAAGGDFHLIDGLWAIENPAVNSPFVQISGRIVRQHGVGIPKVQITITNQTTNLTYQVYSQAQGYYSFSGIPSGANYLITVSHNHFQFEPNSISLFISQDRSNVVFVSKM